MACVRQLECDRSRESLREGYLRCAPVLAHGRWGECSIGRLAHDFGKGKVQIGILAERYSSGTLPKRRSEISPSSIPIFTGLRRPPPSPRLTSKVSSTRARDQGLRRGLGNPALGKA